MHPRVHRLVHELQELPPDADLSLAALARRAGLSPSRFMRVFTESLGIPLRPYLKWLRFQRAVGMLSSMVQSGAWVIGCTGVSSNLSDQFP